jgi:two-component sensor histidine kinase
MGDVGPAAAAGEAPLLRSRAAGNWLLERVRRSSLTTRLLLILVLALTPVIGLAIDQAISVREDERRLQIDTFRERTGHLAERLSIRLKEAEETLATLADLYTLPFDDALACQAQVVRIWSRLRANYTHITFYDRQGNVVCSSSAEHAAETELAQQPFFREAMELNRLSLGLARPQGDRPRIIPVAYPWHDTDGKVRGVVSSALLIDWLREELAKLAPAHATSMALTDRTGRIFAPVRHPRAPLPERVSFESSNVRTHPPRRVERPDGEALLFFHTPIVSQDLGFVVAVAESSLFEAETRLLAVALLQVLLLVGIGGLALWVGLRVLVIRPMRKLTAEVALYRPGSGAAIAAAAPSDPVEIRLLTQSFRELGRRVEALMSESETLLRSKDLLMREVHHRVKNNLQIVSSLLALQANRIRDPQARVQFETARDRISTLSLLHRHLYEQHDVETTAIAPFIRQLVDHLARTLEVAPDRIAIECDIADLRLPPEIVVPLGLTVTELVSNAFKYAYPARNQGTVRISFRAVPAESGEQGVLEVTDQGVGLTAAEFHARGLGSLLIEGFVKQLGGTMRAEGPPGTRITVTFPLPPRPPDDGDARSVERRISEPSYG